MTRAKPSPTPSPARAGVVRMIVADDSPIARHSVGSFLGTLDYVAIQAICENGRSALEHALREPPKAVLLDLQMPEMSGLEAAEIIRSCLPETGVIIMTVHDHPEVRAACLAGGADAFVPKARLVRQFEAALNEALAAAENRMTTRPNTLPESLHSGFPRGSASRNRNWKSPAEATGAKDAVFGLALPRIAPAPPPRRAT